MPRDASRARGFARDTERYKHIPKALLVLFSRYMRARRSRRTAQQRVTGGRWRRIVLGDVLAEHVLELSLCCPSDHFDTPPKAHMMRHLASILNREALYF